MPTEATQQIEDTDEPLLDLSALAPKRPKVRIRTEKNPEGGLYELRVPSELGIIEQQELRSEGAEFAKLWNNDKLSPGGKNRLKKLLDQMFERVLIAPDEIKAQVKDEERQAVVVVFTRGRRRQATDQVRELMEDLAEDESITES